MHEDLLDLLAGQVAEGVADLPLGEPVVPDPERGGGVGAGRLTSSRRTADAVGRASAGRAGAAAPSGTSSPSRELTARNAREDNSAQEGKAFTDECYAGGARRVKLDLALGSSPKVLPARLHPARAGRWGSSRRYLEQWGLCFSCSSLKFSAPMDRGSGQTTGPSKVANTARQAVTARNEPVGMLCP